VSPTGTTSPKPEPATVAPTPNTDKALESFVKSYYAVVTTDRDRTWAQLSPTMQGYAGGRHGYDGFWSTIRSVRVNQVRANASADSAVATLTFTLRHGGTSTETHRFTFVQGRGGYLIESDRLG